MSFLHCLFWLLRNAHLKMSLVHSQVFTSEFLLFSLPYVIWLTYVELNSSVSPSSRKKFARRQFPEQKKETIAFVFIFSTVAIAIFSWTTWCIIVSPSSWKKFFARVGRRQFPEKETIAIIFIFSTIAN